MRVETSENWTSLHILHCRKWSTLHFLLFKAQGSKENVIKRYIPSNKCHSKLIMKKKIISTILFLCISLTCLFAHNPHKSTYLISHDENGWNLKINFVHDRIMVALEQYCNLSKSAGNEDYRTCLIGYFEDNFQILDGNGRAFKIAIEEINFSKNETNVSASLINNNIVFPELLEIHNSCLTEINREQKNQIFFNIKGFETSYSMTDARKSICVPLN